MKPKNFPARKLRRQLRAQGEHIWPDDERLLAARDVRTKKWRGPVDMNGNPVRRAT